MLIAIAYSKMFFFLLNFELKRMIKRQYPSHIIFCMIATSLFFSPTLRCVTSKNPSILWLYYRKCRSFVETEIVPWLTSELVFSASVNHLQFSQFLIKPFHQQSCILAKVNQTFCGRKFEERYIWYLRNNLRLRLDNNMRLLL